MEIEIVKWVQSFSSEALDVVNSLITRFGESIFFVCIFLFVYWCVSYEKAFKLALFYIISVGINNLIKVLVKRPRPWVASADVSNKLQASGFSFPSGHSQSVSAISTFVCYDVCSNKNIKKGGKISAILIAIILCVSVALSRLYLGQHYVTDVLTGLVLGTLIMWGLCVLFDTIEAKYNKKINANKVLIAVSAIMFVVVTFVGFFNFNLRVSTIYKIFKYAGLIIGATVGYVLCTSAIKEIALTNWQKVVKLFCGFITTFGVYFLLSLLPKTNAVAFMIMLFTSFVATFVYPYLFDVVFNKIKKAGNK